MTENMIEVCLEDAAVRGLLEELRERLEVWRKEANIQNSKSQIGRRKFHQAKAGFPFGKRESGKKRRRFHHRGTEGTEKIKAII